MTANTPNYLKNEYSTKEVSEALKIKYHHAAKYAREHNVKFVPNGKTKRYLWNYNDIQAFKNKLENPVKWHWTLKTSQNYNTLFQRLKRAKQKNDTERIIQCTKDLEEFKKLSSKKSYSKQKKQPDNRIK